MKKGATLGQAQAEIASITARFEPPFEQQPQKPSGEVRSFDEIILGNSRRPLAIFLAAVLLVRTRMWRAWLWQGPAEGSTRLRFGRR